MNQVRIVTGKTIEQVNILAESYNRLGKKMGVTTTELAATSADLFRQGLNENQVEDRMKGIIQYAKISGIAIEQSNQIITATANATGESITKITDIFSYLGDTTASGAEEIGESLQRVASAAENSNISLEKTASWIATISSVTRESASTIGRSLSSAISRFESIKSTGFNSEDATKLNDVVEALNSIGIKATDSQGQLRDFADIMDLVGAKYKSLTKNEQSYITTTMFGTFQRNRGITLLNAYNDSLKNYDAALNSSGKTQEKFNIYQESLLSILDKLKVSLEGMWQSSINSEFIANFLKASTAIVSIASQVGIFKVALAALVAYLFMTKKAINGVDTRLLTIGLKGLKLEFTTLKTAMALSKAESISLSAAYKALGVSSKFATIAIEGLKAAATFGLSIAITLAIEALIGTITKAIDKNKEYKESFKLLSDEMKNFNTLLVEVSDGFDTFNTDKTVENLDTAKTAVDSLYQSLLKLKDAVNYDNLVKDLESAKVNLEFATKARDEAVKNGEIKDPEFMTFDMKKYTKQIDDISMSLDPVIKKEETLAEKNEILKWSIYDMMNVQKYGTKVTEVAVKTQEELTEAYDETQKAISDYSSEMSNIGNIQEDINSGEKLSLETLTSLLEKYPELTTAIMSANNSKKDGANLTRLLFEAEKQKSLAAITGMKEEIKLSQTLLEATYNEAKLKEKLASLAGEDTGGIKSALAEAFSALSASRQQLAGLTGAYDLINKSKIGDFVGKDSSSKTEKATKELEKYFDAQNEINTLKAEESSIETKAQISGKNASDDLIDNLNLQQSKLEALEQLKISDLALDEAQLAKMSKKDKLSEKGIELQEKIADLHDSIDSDAQSQLDIQLKIKNIQQEQLDILKDQKTLASEVSQSYLDTVNSVNDSISSTKDNITSLENELSDLGKQKALAPFQKELENISEEENRATENLTKFKNSQEALIASVGDSYSKSIDDLTDTIQEYQDKMSDISLQETFSDESMTVFQHAQEKALDSINNKYQDTIDLLSQEIELEKLKNDEINNEIELQNKLQSIEDAKTKLANAKNNRIDKNLNEDGTWSHIANSETVKTAQDELTQANEDYADYQKDNNLKLKEDKLKTLQDERDAELKTVQDIIDARQTEYDEKKYQWDREKYLIEESIRVNNDNLTMLTEQKDARIKIIQDIVDARQLEFDTKQYNWDREKYRLNEEISKIETRYSLEEESIQSLINKKQSDIDFESARLATLINIRDTDLLNFTLWKDGQLLGYDELIAKKALLEKINGTITGTTSANTSSALIIASNSATSFGSKSSAESESYFSALKASTGGNKDEMTQIEIARTQAVIEAKKGADTSAQEAYLKKLKAGTVQFEYGGDVTKDGLQYLHNKEGVIPAPIWTDLKKFILTVPEMVRSISIPSINFPSLNTTNNTQSPIQFFGDVTLQGNNPKELATSIKRLRQVGVR